MEKTQSHCTGNCMSCNPFQRQFCASQIAYNNMLMIDEMTRLIKTIEEKVEALQNNEATLIDPLDTAQEGDGAKVDAPK